jgi:quinol monooxygenase YgiN
VAGFIQIIEYQTMRFDEVRQLGEDFREQAKARGTGPERVTITKNRDMDNSYVTIAEFASYDAAMANSNDPATQQFAEAMAKLCDGPPNFYNLDYLDSWSKS